VSQEFQDLLRAEMAQVEASPRADLVREAHQSQRRRQQARRRGGLAATVAAAAAVATVVALQPGASRPRTSAAPGASAQTAAPATANPGGAADGVQTTAAPVTATFTAETNVTVASVLDKAARASGSGNLQLVNGWPAAPYWHTLSQQTTPSCPGQVITNNTWLGKDGTKVLGTEVAGPRSSISSSSCYVPLTGNNLEIGNPAGITFGGQQYSWAQFAALPTDPAKLWPILEADANVGPSGTLPGAAAATDRLETTYWWVVQALIYDPLSPAMREALFEVMGKFPSVHVTGTYTDSLGRTGTAITFTAPHQANDPMEANNYSFTDVIDAETGQVLAELDGAQPVTPGCVRATLGGVKGATCTVTGADIQVFIGAGPASTTPLHFASLTVPSVVGDSVDQAAQVLYQAGFKNGVSFKGPTGKELRGSPKDLERDLKVGVVIAQSPAAGTTASSATETTLTLKF